MRIAGNWIQLKEKWIYPLPSQSESIQIVMMVTYFLFPNSVRSKTEIKHPFLSVINVSV